MERFLKYSNLLTNTDITFKGQDRNIFLSNYAEAEQLNYSQIIAKILKLQNKLWEVHIWMMSLKRN